MMMGVIATNTIKEFIRNKIVYIILVFGIGLLFFTLVLSKLALSEQQKIILDFSLTTIEIFGLILTLFLGSSLLYNEISKNTILLILSKKPSRSEFILGKYLGFAAIIALLYIVLSIAFLGVVWLHSISLQGAYFVAIFLSYIKLAVTLGFIVFFSTFISPFITLLLTLAIYFISHMTTFLKFYVTVFKKVSVDSLSVRTLDAIYFIFPNFHDLSMKEYLMSPFLGSYTLPHIGLSVAVNIFYIAVLLFFGIMIFNRKEF